MKTINSSPNKLWLVDQTYWVCARDSQDAIAAILECEGAKLEDFGWEVELPEVIRLKANDRWSKSKLRDETGNTGVTMWDIYTYSRKRGVIACTEWP